MVDDCNYRISTVTLLLNFHCKCCSLIPNTGLYPDPKFVLFPSTRLLWICRTGLLCTAPAWSQHCACLCASSCGPVGSRTPGAPCPGCCSSRWRHTTSATAFATASGCFRLATLLPSPTGCMSPSQPPSLTCALCSCIWPARETWSPPNTESP